MSGRCRDRGRHGDRLSQLFPQSRPRGVDATTSKSGSTVSSGSRGLGDTVGDLTVTGGGRSPSTGRGSTSSRAPPSSFVFAVDTHGQKRCYISDLRYV